MPITRFDERFAGALAVLYEAYSLNEGKWPSQTKWNARMVQAVLCSDVKFHAQLLQDAFVLATTDYLRAGEFVEIGVGDGRHLSNTLTLERDFAWRGLLIEANPFFWSKIEKHRPDAKLAKTAVLANPRGRMTFRHVADFPEVSSLDGYAESDHNDRSKSDFITVETAGIVSVLQANGISLHPDYVSIDVEGPEVEILSAILAGGYRPRILTIEHNRIPERVEMLTSILSDDYQIVLSSSSQWDLWAVEKALAHHVESIIR